MIERRMVEIRTPDDDAGRPLRRRRWQPLRIGPGLRLFPGLFFLVYLTGTVLLFAFGPWPWPVKDGVALYGFLAAVHVALLLGYVSGASAQSRGYGFSVVPTRLFPLALALGLVLLLPTVAARTGRFIPDVSAGVANPGAAYNLSVEAREDGSPLVIVEYIRILLAPALALVIPLTIYYWRSLHPWTRALGATYIAGWLACFVAMGTNKAIADVLLVGPWLIFASHIAGFRRLRPRHYWVGLAIVGVGFLLFFSFFTAGQLTRRGSGASAAYFPATAMYADQQHVLVRYLPPEPRAGALALMVYLSHGYYGLYLSMQEPFVPMFGVGNSFFLQRTAARVFSKPEIAMLPYPIRAERRGWSALGLWSSIYPWLASDVSFPGVLLVVFFIGRFFAQSWLDALHGGNPFAVAAFSMLTLMVFYFPANNQLLQDGEPLVGFVIIVGAWQLTRRGRRAVADA